MLHQILVWKTVYLKCKECGQKMSKYPTYTQKYYFNHMNRMFGKWKPFNPEPREGEWYSFSFIRLWGPMEKSERKDGKNGMVWAILISLTVGRITMLWPGHTE